MTPADEIARSDFRNSWYTLDQLRKLRGGVFLRLEALGEGGKYSAEALKPYYEFVSEDVGGVLLELDNGAPMQVTMGAFLSIAVLKSRDKFWGTQPQEEPSDQPTEADYLQALAFENHNAALAFVTELMMAE